MSSLSDKLEELTWILRYGRPTKKIAPEVLLADLSLIDRPVFFLSTGRCGTKWFSSVIGMDSDVRVLHAPTPGFALQNAYLHRLWQDDDMHMTTKVDFCRNLFITGRESYLRYSYKCDKRFIETNNHITFFAPALAEIFPNALFVHLYRHPGEFVRSGIRRKWFDSNAAANNKLISSKNKDQWNKWTQNQKIAWVWNETNSFIEEFKKTIDPNRIASFNFNKKDEASITALIDFLDVNVSFHQVKSKMESRINRQTSGHYPNYDEWSESDRADIRNICGPLAATYNYDL